MGSAGPADETLHLYYREVLVMTKHESIRQQGGDVRCDATSFQDYLDLETVPVPEYLRENTCPDMGDADLPVSRYLSREFHDLEKRKLWPRVWQVACRQEDIPQVGDHIVYDIVDDSVIVMRSAENEIRAFINSCLHRGRPLRDESGSVGELRCPFHGFTWGIDGEYKGNPCPWDFKHLEGRDMRLPQVRVGTWGGFVFINLSASGPSLEEYIGVIPDHFARFPLEDYYVAAHVQKVVNSNWKVGAEAFMESWHTKATHAVILPFTGDSNSQYDCFGDNISRSVTPMGVPSPHTSGISEAQTLKNILLYSGRMATADADKYELPEGMTARRYVAELNRTLFGEACGQDLSDATDAELQDAILYSIFPNFQVWIGYGGNIVYRFRPNGDDHETCIFDSMILLRYKKGKEPRPAPATTTVLRPDQSFADAPEIGALGPVFDQDNANMAVMHKGMKASRKGAVSLASYQESRIRHLHQTIDKYLKD
jgi:phenylpropionate dioxygenase-like ring-hydroxylating dioxygenase large terminal subunit